MTTNLHLGQTLRVPLLPVSAPATASSRPRGGVSILLLGLVLVLVVLLAGSIGYILAGSRQPLSSTAEPAATSVAVVTAPASTSPPLVVAPTQGAAPTPAQVVAAPTPVPPTATAPPPTIATAQSPLTPTAAPPTPTAPRAISTPAAAVTLPPTSAPAADPRRALVERHVSEYFAALNAGDYARAQAACCTPAWRSRYPLDDWKKNFTGVGDLRFATPFRYPTAEASRIIVDVDYSFTVSGSGSGRRFFTLRFTFVPSGADWLADDAVAAAQR